MILGTISIDHRQRAVHTHRDSYLLDNLSVVSVRRPLLPAGIMFGVGLAGFALVFADILYLHEIAVALALAAGTYAAGTGAGQLKLLSRDLRGSELSGVVWGEYRQLNTMRREIVAALAPSEGGAS